MFHCNAPFHLFPNACYCSWPVSVFHLRLVHTVSLKDDPHCFQPQQLKPNKPSHMPSSASYSWLWECANGALNSQNYPLRVLFIADQAWSIRSKRCATIQTAMRFSTTVGRMLSIPFNALSEASSMSFTYPPTTKLSKLFTLVFFLQPQYTEPKEKLTSVQQTLELTFSSCEPSLPPLWNNSFMGKLYSMKLHQSVVFCI